MEFLRARMESSGACWSRSPEPGADDGAFGMFGELRASGRRDTKGARPPRLQPKKLSLHGFFQPGLSIARSAAVQKSQQLY